MKLPTKKQFALAARAAAAQADPANVYSESEYRERLLACRAANERDQKALAELDRRNRALARAVPQYLR